MAKTLKIPVIGLIVICAAISLVTPLIMVTHFSTTTHANMVDDIKDICIILNTNINDPNEINWKGFYDAMGKADGTNV